MVEAQKNLRNKMVFAVLAFIIPVIIFRNVFLIPGITQGNYTILTSDLNGQYVSYFMHFRDALLHGKGLLYSFSLSLGNDTFSLLGYYLLNPLNLIALAFPADKISAAIYLIITIKIGLIGLCAFLYFARKHESYAFILVFSTTYALSGYVFSFFMNLMWLDSLYFLPLVAMGVELLIEKGRSWVYVLSLALAIIFCYYTGYMLAGFSFLFFVYLFISKKRGVKTFFVSLLRYIFSSAIAVGLSLMTLLPTLLSQMGNRNESEVEEIFRSPFNVLAKLFTAATNLEDFNSGLPQIYCGMFILLLCIVYFLSKSVPIRKKLGGLFLLSALFLSFCIVPLDKIWHGFTYPNGFLYRYSFIFIFVMIMLAEEYISEKHCSGVVAIIISVVAVMMLAEKTFILNLPITKPLWLIVDCVSALLLAICIYFAPKRKNWDRYIIYGVMVLLHISMLFANAGYFAKIHNYDDYSCEGYYKMVAPPIKSLQRIDSDFYRMEKVFYHSLNDPMMFSYPGISHFSSASKSGVRSFLKKIGYTERNDLWISYSKGATLAGDSLVGIRYVLSEEKGIHELDSTNKLAEYFVNENKYAFPIGMACSDSVLDVNELNSSSPFENLETIYAALDEDEADLFYSYEVPEIELENLEYKDDFYSKLEDDIAVITMELTAADANPLYLYLPAEYYPGLIVFANRIDAGEYLTVENHGILPLGCFRPGEQVTIRLILQEGYTNFGVPQICSLNVEKLEKISQKYQNQGWEVQSTAHGHIEATVDIPKEATRLLMTIPYDENWVIRVDGEERIAEKALDIFMSVPLTEGKHSIELYYRPAGLLFGLIGSFIALLAASLLFALEDLLAKKAKKSKQLVAEMPEKITASNMKVISEAKENKVQDNETRESKVQENIAQGNKAQETSAQETSAQKKEDNSAEEKFLLMEYKGHCQFCNSEIGTAESEAHFVHLFDGSVSKQEEKRFPGWNKICLCENCAFKFEQKEMKIPTFFDVIRHTKVDEAQEYEIPVQTPASIWITENIKFSAKHLQSIQRAVYLFEWIDSIVEKFRF